MSRTPKPQPAGAKALTGSAEAMRKAAVILEALCGLRTTQQASDELGIALVRYYVLETRMLQAMIVALEPIPRGRKRSDDAERKQLEADNQRLRREVLRLQSLYRTTQRAVGIQDASKAVAKGKAKTTRVRRPRTKTRGERVLSTLRTGLSEPVSGSAKITAGPEVSCDGDGATEQGCRARRGSRCW